MSPRPSRGGKPARGGRPAGGRPPAGRSPTGRSAAGRSPAARSTGGRSPAGRSPGGRAAGGSSPGARSPGARSKAPRNAPLTRVPASRGAGRTGAARRDDAAKPASAKSLGGEQIEGRQAVRELLIAGRRKVHEVWIAADRPGVDPLPDDEVVEGGPLTDIIAIAHANRVPVLRVARNKLEAAARTEAPQGVIAKAAALPEVELPELLRRRAGKVPFLVAIDGVTDPGNLGAILRCCDGAGVSGVVVPRHRAVHITPTAAKAAAGAIEHLPIAVVPGLPAAITRMRDAGVWVVGLDDAADRSLFDLGDLAVEALCLVLGAEGAGLSRLVRERCDLVVSIPMRGRLSSLNVSAAAALATYEVARARS